MAYPTSSTFVAGAILTAAQLNALRADVLALSTFVRKTADESVTSSTVVQNDDHLFVSIPAAGTYLVDVYVDGVSAANAAGDLAVGFAFPTGTLELAVSGLDATLASGASGTVNESSSGAATTGATFAFLGLSTAQTQAHIHGMLIATASGTLQFMWAQASSSVSASTVKSGSHMLVRQVA